MSPSEDSASQPAPRAGCTGRWWASGLCSQSCRMYRDHTELTSVVSSSDLTYELTLKCSEQTGRCSSPRPAAAFPRKHVCCEEGHSRGGHVWGPGQEWGRGKSCFYSLPTDASVWTASHGLAGFSHFLWGMRAPSMTRKQT